MTVDWIECLTKNAGQWKMIYTQPERLIEIAIASCSQVAL